MCPLAGQSDIFCTWLSQIRHFKMYVASFFLLFFDSKTKITIGAKYQKFQLQNIWLGVGVCVISVLNPTWCPLKFSFFIPHFQFSIAIFFLFCLSYFVLFFLSSDSRIFVHYFNFLLFSFLLFPLLSAFHTSFLHSYSHYSDFDPRRFSTFRCHFISTKDWSTNYIQPSHSSACLPICQPVCLPICQPVCLPVLIDSWMHGPPPLPLPFPSSYWHPYQHPYSLSHDVTLTFILTRRTQASY